MTGILVIDNLMSDEQRWNAINWHKAEKIVHQIQARIVKAVKAGDKRRVRSLQRLLSRSFAAKLLAVKRVTTNKGKNTAGIDGVLWKTPTQKWQSARKLNKPDYKALPLRRKYIPKGKGKKKRPLGIPTMRDRAEQALALLALLPIAETTADGQSNGFRPKRSVHDAIAACYNALRLKGSPAWIFEADIKGCFDYIDHQWILDHIPMDKRVLRMWLKAGCMNNGTFNPTPEGTPQGGIISPTLANMTLDGIEKLLKKHFKRHHKVHFVRFADDFIITAATKELLENEVKPLVQSFLNERGLVLSKQKSTITHIHDGFDFLGFNIRKYGNKLLIKPSKSNIQQLKDKVRRIIKAYRTAKTINLVYKLNEVIRGWGNYYRHVVSKRIFGYLDHTIWQMTWRWAKRRHPKKGLRWIKRKYFQHEGLRNWVFREKQDKTSLFKLASIPIRRHIKIRADANPFDIEWREYFILRSKKRNTKQLVAV